MRRYFVTTVLTIVVAYGTGKNRAATIETALAALLDSLPYLPPEEALARARSRPRTVS